MKRVLQILSPLLAGLFICLPATAQIYGDAARVNGVPISNLRLERFFDEYVKDKGRNIGKMINPRIYKKLKREALDLLIEREVLWQAAQQSKIDVPEAELDAIVASAAAQARSRETFLLKLEEAGFDEAGFREYVRGDIAGTRYLMQATEKFVEVSEEDIRTVYERNHEQLMLPETVRARHILLRVDAAATPEDRSAVRTRLADLLGELRNGADFAELAQRHSEDPTASVGGDLGSFTRGRMVPSFEVAVFALQVGEISEIVETPFGYHLIKVESHTAEKSPTLEEASERIRQQLAAERRRDKAKQLTAELVAGAKVETLVYLDSSR